MPVNKAHILSTRPLSGELTDEAAANGVRIDILSFIDTVPVRDAVLSSQIREIGRQSVLAVFTSMNAVEAVANHLRGAPVNWRIYCIGATTRDEVIKNFGGQHIAGMAPSAIELASEILRDRGDAAVREVFFFCGDQRRDELPAELASNGIQVNELVVYNTIQTPHVVKKVYEGVVFFSPSAVHSFFSVNTVPAATVLFAIGQTTAGAIREYADNPTISSGSPGKEVLIRLAIEHFTKE